MIYYVETRVPGLLQWSCEKVFNSYQEAQDYVNGRKQFLSRSNTQIRITL